ncbi:leucine-rich repeat domain-containing protein [Anaeromicropila herbilytica]|uniref:Leucine-rich repeat domain-containing protein n=1 Tax=Anaeromicropila herbilytica TaxID=2785025 RepID=A0A7R7ICG1_9FIRM|nr:leucine-rich repeat domain-containing protein [Anaeromicropila herbilytica]BCN28913.1 hypothetical protein bsdtb5_02080 [Anaeromicropila herbilytica]
MKKKKKQVFAVLLAALILIVSTYGNTPIIHASKQNFDIRNGVLVKYNGSGGAVSIPSTVKSIGKEAFASSDITSVNIPNSVTYIGENSFMSCPKLKKIVIPSSVQKIDIQAFCNDKNLEQVQINNKEIVMDRDVFEGTKWLKNHTEEYVILNGNLIHYNGTDSLIEIPNQVRVICGGVFTLTELKKVTIPESVKIIGSNAFDGQTKLMSVIMNNSVEKIGDYAFYQCESLKNIKLPTSLITIGDQAFYDAGLTSITLPESVKKVGFSSFAGCEKLIEVNIPKSVKNIAEDAFRGSAFVDESTNEFFMINHMLLKYNGTNKDVVIPEGVTKIMSMAFYNTKLTTVKMPNTITEVGSMAFASCNNLKSITLSNSLTSIHSAAFKGCVKLSNIDLPKKLKIIGDSVFENSGLRTIKLPEGLTTIEDYAFACNNLQQISIPKTVKHLGDSFNGGKMKKLILQEGIKALPYLTDVYCFVIPNSVIQIDKTYRKNNNLYTFICKKSSYAYKYAERYHIKYNVIK